MCGGSFSRWSGEAMGTGIDKDAKPGTGVDLGQATGDGERSLDLVFPLLAGRPLNEARY